MTRIKDIIQLTIDVLMAGPITYQNAEKLRHLILVNEYLTPVKNKVIIDSDKDWQTPKIQGDSDFCKSMREYKYT